MYKKKQIAGALIVGGAFTWRHLRMRKERAAACTKISKFWRGYCVRTNLNHLRESINRIKKWWKTQRAVAKAMEVISEIVLLHRSANSLQQRIRTIQIQQWWRSVRNRKNGMKRLKRAVVVLQSRYRKWKAQEEVSRLRAYVGLRVSRLPSQLVALIPSKGRDHRMTRFRPFRTREPPRLKTARLVRLKVLPFMLRTMLEDHVVKLQAFARTIRLKQAVTRIQSWSRGCLSRERLWSQQVAATRIQACWRQRLAKANLARLRRATITIQSVARGYVVRQRLKRGVAPDELHVSSIRLGGIGLLSAPVASATDP